MYIEANVYISSFCKSTRGKIYKENGEKNFSVEKHNLYRQVQFCTKIALWLKGQRNATFSY